MKRNATIFIIFGLIYGLLEILWRGYTSLSMIIVGGICGLIVGLINEKFNYSVLSQMVIGMVIVTVIEFVSGYVLNIKLGLGIWDYSNMKYNFMGQICPQFSMAWFFLSYAIIYIDDYIRKVIKIG